jgi:hypothetical protein
MCNNCYACEFSTTLQQASFGSNFLSYTKEDFECRISATKSCDAVLFFSLSRWVDILEKMGKGREKKGQGGEGRTEEFLARLCRILIHDFASIHGGCSRTFP